MAVVRTSAGIPFTDTGLPRLSVDEALASVDDMVSRIRLCFGVSRETFDAQVRPLLQRYATYVHLLPATADNYFSSAGGLLRLGLEVAFYSLQGTDGHIFSRGATISARRDLEPRWRLGTFIGGLCCELHRPLGHLVVTDAFDAEWPACMLPLSEWLGSRAADRYYVRWRPEARESRGLGLFALPMVVPPETLQFLGDGNTVIIPHLLASIGGVLLHHDHNVLDNLVRRASALVINRDLKASADRHGAPPLGAHLERHLVDAMRRLSATSSAWIPNSDKSRVWLGPEGLFLHWPRCAADMQALLEADQLVGIPKAPETILEVLLGAGVIQQQDDGSKTWSILPPDARTPLQAVKLTSPRLLVGDIHSLPVAMSCPLVFRPGDPHPAPRCPEATTSPRPAPPPGTQYSLIEPMQTSAAESAAPERTNSAEARADQSSVPSEPVPHGHPSDATIDSAPARSFRLSAPMRLHPTLRTALSDIVDTLNGPASTAAAVTVEDGLFVPLDELEVRGIQPALAARALGDTGLLVHPDRSRPATRSLDLGGQNVLGLVLGPGCVEHLDLPAFPHARKAEP